MTSKSNNTIDINLGGQVRPLKFSMRTQERYLTELRKGIGKELDSENWVTQIKLLIYCALVVADKTLTTDFNYNTFEDWVDDADQTEFDVVSEMAAECMGFITKGNLQQLKALGINQEELIQKVLNNNQS